MIAALFLRMPSVLALAIFCLIGPAAARAKVKAVDKHLEAAICTVDPVNSGYCPMVYSPLLDRRVTTC